MKRVVGIGYLSGAVLVLGGLAHAFMGWPPLHTALAEAGVDRGLVGALAVGWYFGSVSMLTFGAIVLVSVRHTRPGTGGGFSAPWLISAAYIGFGIAAYVLRDFNRHFLIFVLSGLLVALYASLASRMRSAP